MSSEGYIKSYRPKKDDPLYFDEPFTKWQAWHDLLFLAQWETGKQTVVRGIVVDEKRGCVYMSQSSLAERWKWDRKRVIRFLRLLEKLGRVELQKSNVINSISITNYEKYQSNDTTNDTTNDTHIKNIKNINNSLNRGLTPPFGGVVSKPKKAKKVKVEPTIVTKARSIFENYFSKQYGDSYYWSAKDAVAMKRLLQKIKFSRTNRPNSLPVDDEALCNALGALLRSIDKNWIVNNFSVTKIDSQYNEIISEIKNRNHGSRQNTENGSDKRRGVEITATSAKDYEGAF